LRTPQVVCYRSNASRLIDTLYPLVLKVRYISLPNLIADAPVVPELLFHHCNASRIAPLLASLLADSPARAAMLTGYATIASRLTTAHSARTAASRLYNHLK
jgi:lipid-A-disaccharide synthase